MASPTLRPIVFRCARPETLRIVHFDAFTLVYHRASGITHLLAAPAPEILATLGEAGMTQVELDERLDAVFELGDADPAALAARLGELVAAGLVEAT